MQQQGEAPVATGPDHTAPGAADAAADVEGLPVEPTIFQTAIDYMMDQWLWWLPDYDWAQSLVVVIVLLLAAALVHLVLKRYVVRMIRLLMKRLPDWWEHIIAEHKVLHRLVPILPTIIIGRGVAVVPHLPWPVVDFVQRVAQATIVLLIALSFGALLSSINDIYGRYPIARGRPIKGYLQVVKLVAYIAAGILMIAALMAESPWVFLTGLGAMTAIIMLIFRDTLLSLVAGIQLVNNDLVRVGDWIEMPQFNADGDVVDIQLNVVKVSNWDKTITVIPTHKFLENSFKNWRGMSESGGRRIKRAVYIDMSTIRFLTDQEIERFSKFRLLRDYVMRKKQEIAEYNATVCRDKEEASMLANVRHLTNVGTFRAYVFEYLKAHPMVHQDMTLLVRQLQPGPQGLPIELYTFVNDTRWAVYEAAQSDIFDHVLAIAGEFGLRVFQEPTGYDLVQLRSDRRSSDGSFDFTPCNGEPFGSKAEAHSSK